MIYFRTLLTFLLFASCDLHGQHRQEDYISRVSQLPGKEVSPDIAAKTNLTYNLASSLNLGFEVRLSDCLPLDESVNFIPWAFSDDVNSKDMPIQPELRYCLYEPFNGYFTDAHLTSVNFSAGDVNLPLGVFSDLKNYRYCDDSCETGIIDGCQWMLSPCWNKEAVLSLGYLISDYARYEHRACGGLFDSESKHSLGQTEPVASFVYVLNKERRPL